MHVKHQKMITSIILACACALACFLSSCSSTPKSGWIHAPSEQKALNIEYHLARTINHPFDSIPCAYRFSSSARESRIVARSARFYDAKSGSVLSEPIGPFPMDIALSADSRTLWQDGLFVDESVLLRQVLLGSGGGDIILKQSFLLEDGEEIRVDLPLKAGPELKRALDSQILEGDGMRLLARASDMKQPKRAARLEALIRDLGKAKAALEAECGGPTERDDPYLVEVLYDTAWVPNGRSWGRVGSKSNYPDMRIIRVPRPMLFPDPLYTLSLGKGAQDFHFYVLCHELTHLMLEERFPKPPRWFKEGPAVFFGYKASAAAERTAFSEGKDKPKVEARAASALKKDVSFFFQNDYDPRPSFYFREQALGYRFLSELEPLLGAKGYRGFFTFLRRSGFTFQGVATDLEKTRRFQTALLEYADPSQVTAIKDLFTRWAW